MKGNLLKTIAVAGATGHQGGAVARHLLRKRFKVRGLTRDPDSEASRELALCGAEMMRCELNDPAEVRRALDGVWGAFGVFATAPDGAEHEEKQSMAFARQAKDAGVRHYVYSSVASAGRRTGIPHFESKWLVENGVRGMGFPSYTILRPAFFMENFLSPWLWKGISQGKLSLPLEPSTKLQMIAVDDIGAAGLLAFEQSSRYTREEAELAGDELTMPEAAEILSGVLDRKVEFEQVPIEEFRRTGSSDMALMYQWFDRTGYNVDIKGFQDRFGFKPMTFTEWTAKVRWPVKVAG